MANIFQQAQAFIPGVQQIFQNVGYNRQQGGQSSGFVPRALGGSGMVAPNFGVAKAYASDGGGTSPSPTGSGGGAGGGGGTNTTTTNRPTGNPTGQIQAPTQNNGGSQQYSEPDLYGQIGSVFDDLLGSFGGQQADLEGKLRSSADTQKAGINEQLGYGVQALNQSREGVKTGQANTLADLAQSMRDSARNVGSYIGGRGAGNSSAADAASFALQKVFGKERAGVQRQASQQMADIDTQENTLKAKASEMMSGVDTWFNSQMADLSNQFNALRNNIGTMKGNMRAQAVQTLYDRANQIQSERENYARAIQENAMSRLQSLSDLRLELSNSANFDPQAMVYNEYGFNPAQSGATDVMDMFNPMAMAKKKQQELTY